MFCNKPKSAKSVPSKKNKKRKRKPTHFHGVNQLRGTNQNHLNIAHAMSTWAQNYTAATTWQLKHQVAYWKSRAIALKYENKVLHEMIRDQHFKQPAKPPCKEVPDSSESDEELENDDEEEENENEGDDGAADAGDEQNDDLEVSEEFIEFLKQNAKFRANMRKEQELLKAKQRADKFDAFMKEKKLESSEVKQAKIKELYGDDWEKITTLETSMLCAFISECDKAQAEYWPNIPFNFKN